MDIETNCPPETVQYVCNRWNIAHWPSRASLITLPLINASRDLSRTSSDTMKLVGQVEDSFEEKK